MTNSHDSIAQACFEICLAAGQKAKTYFDEYQTISDISHKSDGSLVSEADKAVETFIRAEIQTRFPDHAIVGEEFDDTLTKSDYLWHIDPIDGTTNFLKGVPLFATILGVSHQKQPLAAALYDPTLDALYQTDADHPSTVQNQSFLPPQTVNSLEEITIIVEWSRVHKARALALINTLGQQARSVRKYGAHLPALQQARHGQLDLMIHFCHNYDFELLAPAHLLENAGYLVLNNQGENWLQYRRNDFIVLNPSLEPHLAEILELIPPFAG